MQICSVDILLADGTFTGPRFATSAPALEVASQIRKSGTYEGKPVRAVIVRASWQVFAMTEFTIPQVAVEAEAADTTTANKQPRRKKK